MLRNLLIALTLFCLSTFVAAEIRTNDPIDIVPKPVPAGFNFPTPAATIDKWIATSDNKAIHAHAWDLWAALSSGSNEFYNGTELPIFETWYTDEDIFKSGVVDLTNNSAATFLATHRKLVRDFTLPHQLMRKHKFRLADLLGPIDERLMAFNKFNPEAAEFMLSAQSGPGDKKYHYNIPGGVEELNAAWPSDRRVRDRGINSFPLTAIETKPVFDLVDATGLTPIPLWQGAADSTQPLAPTSYTWKTCVLIDPKGTIDHLRPATSTEIASVDVKKVHKCKKFYYGSLSMLYHFHLSPEEAAAFSKARKQKTPHDAYGVLVAMHINTHETPFWTWQTYYWQPPGADDSMGPGSKKDQPKNLKSPWNNYAACVSYSQTETPGGSKMSICFNPYLEPGLPDGLESNCVSCHAVARVGDDAGFPFPLKYNKPVEVFTDPLYYSQTTTNTEFSWALAR